MRTTLTIDDALRTLPARQRCGGLRLAAFCAGWSLR
jgi:hypothetical protein